MNYSILYCNKIYKLNLPVHFMREYTEAVTVRPRFVQQPTTTLGITSKVNNFDHVVTQQCYADRICVWAFVWMVLETLQTKSFSKWIFSICYFSTCESQTFLCLLNLKVTLSTLWSEVGCIFRHLSTLFLWSRVFGQQEFSLHSNWLGRWP